MGCDIHCFVEKRNSNGDWNPIGGFVSDYYDPNSKYFSKPEFKNASSPLEGRNYRVFAILAGVRDYSEDVPQIDEPRGLPEDVSNYVQNNSEEYGCDGHSHSWVTVREIIDYDEKQLIINYGILPLAQYQQALETGGVVHDWGTSWNSANNGFVVKKEEVDTKVKQVQITLEHPTKDICVETVWKEEVGKWCGQFFKRTLDQLKARCTDPSMEDVRLVFWFDN